MQILNEIEFLDANKVIPHEEPSNERLNKLVLKIKKDGFVNHPIVCTNIKDKIIILDGTHRYNALKEIGVKFIPIQLVSYDRRRIKLNSWAWQFKFDDQFLAFIRSFDGRIFKEVRNPRNYEVLIKSRDSFILKFNNRVEFLKFLNELKNISYERVLRKDVVEGIVFPKLDHSFFFFLAKNNYRIPSGITRFKVERRILFLKVSLDVLNDEKLIFEFKEKLKERKFRIYEESVLIFED